jgi:hypothetical protein
MGAFTSLFISKGLIADIDSAIDELKIEIDKNNLSEDNFVNEIYTAILRQNKPTNSLKYDIIIEKLTKFGDNIAKNTAEKYNGNANKSLLVYNKIQEIIGKIRELEKAKAAAKAAANANAAAKANPAKNPNENANAKAAANAKKLTANANAAEKAAANAAEKAAANAKKLTANENQANSNRKAAANVNLNAVEENHNNALSIASTTRGNNNQSLINNSELRPLKNTSANTSTNTTKYSNKLPEKNSVQLNHTIKRDLSALAERMTKNNSKEFKERCFQANKDHVNKNGDFYPKINELAPDDFRDLIKLLLLSRTLLQPPELETDETIIKNYVNFIFNGHTRFDEIKKLIELFKTELKDKNQEQLKKEFNKIASRLVVKYPINIPQKNTPSKGKGVSVRFSQKETSKIKIIEFPIYANNKNKMTSGGSHKKSKKSRS